jgi:hypothetical protein
MVEYRVACLFCKVGFWVQGSHDPNLDLQTVILDLADPRWNAACEHIRSRQYGVIDMRKRSLSWD